MRYAWLMPLPLCACGAPTAEPVAPADNQVAPVASPTPAATPSPVATFSPTAEPVVAPDSAEAAADVVRRYHRLIAERRIDDALRLWEPGAAPDDLAATAARYAGSTTQVGAPGRIDAGAGQRYVTVPFTITATAADGGTTRTSGTATLHRSGDIDGATAEQRSWRIRSIEMAGSPDAASPPARR